MIVLYFVFWGKPVLFSIVSVPIYIPTNCVPRFLFLHVPTSTCYFLSYWWQPFWQVWGDISLWFWFAFCWWPGYWASFNIPVCQLCVFFEKMSIEFLFSFCNQVVCCYWAAWIPFILRILSPYLIYGLQIFSQDMETLCRRLWILLVNRILVCYLYTICILSVLFACYFY